MRSLALLLMLAVSAVGHHSASAEFDGGQTITVDGTVTAFLYSNPHATLTVMDQSGISWSAEWASPNRLRQWGIGKDSVKPGDRVTLIGNPSKTLGSARLHPTSITRASDGWKWSGGSY